MGTHNHESPQPECTGHLRLETCLELLAEKRRRDIIHYLREEPAPVAVADLASQIADWEAEQTPTPSEDRQAAVYRALYHWHVPKLVEADVVAHNKDRNTVEPAANFSCVTTILDTVSDVPDAERV